VARTTTRPESDEDEIMDDVEEEVGEEESEASAGPAVSDSRRRRQLKRGETVQPQTTSAATRKERPTPSQRTEVTKSDNAIVRFMQSIQEYFLEVRAELRKVTWLSWEETRRLGTIVLIVTAIAAAFLGAISFLFGYLTQLIATQGSTIPAGAAAIAIVVIVGLAWLFRDQLFGNRFEA